MARLIQTEIKRVLADEILFGRLRDGGRVEIDTDDGALTFAYTPAEPTAAPPAAEEPDELEAADAEPGGDGSSSAG